MNKYRYYDDEKKRVSKTEFEMAKMLGLNYYRVPIIDNPGIRWDRATKVLLAIVFLLWLVSLFTFQRTYTTPNGGEYTCKGLVLKICSGDEVAYEYVK